jgi:hypothetical protein
VTVDNGVLTDYAVSSDETAGGKHVQIVKLALSADASETPITADTDGLLVNLGTNNDTKVVPHIGLNGDPYSLVHEGVQYTTTQTSAVLVAGGASEKLVVTQATITATGSDAGDMILYFGTGAYSRGTSRAIHDGNFIPSTTISPGVVLPGPFISGTNGDDLMVTTTGNIDVTISVWYYVVT